MSLYGLLFIQCCIRIQNIVTGYITVRIHVLQVISQQNLLNDLLLLFLPYFIRQEEIQWESSNYNPSSIDRPLVMPEQNG